MSKHKSDDFIESEGMDIKYFTPDDKIVESEDFNFEDIETLSAKLGVKKSGSSVRGLKGSSRYNDSKMIELLNAKVTSININEVYGLCNSTNKQFGDVKKVTDYLDEVKKGNEKLTDEQYTQVQRLQSRLNDLIYWGCVSRLKILANHPSINIPIEVTTTYKNKWVVTIDYK